MKPSVISLFSGAGGIDYGLEAAGFGTVVAVERDHDCCESLRASRSWPVIERSIFDVPTDEILSAGGVKRGDVDLLVGGPPCQPFSKAGYWSRGDSLRLDDPRADTLSAYIRVLEETLPRAFLIENVEGLQFSGKDEGLQLLLKQIERVNKRTKSQYRPHVRVLNAAEHGVPQTRERVFIVAARDGGPFRFPEPRYSAPEDRPSLLPPVGEPFRTTWDALGDVELEPGEDLAVRGKWGALLPSIPEGANYLHHTDRGNGLPIFGWRRRYWSFLLKLAKNRPSWTIQAQPGPAIGPFHWSNRRLSIRELCRLQTFPDDAKIVGSRASQQKQLGNAVPSLLAEVMGREIATQLLGLTVPRALRLLPPRRTPIPAAERTASVPKPFRDLVGRHDAHPGTGRGYGALARA